MQQGGSSSLLCLKSGFRLFFFSMASLIQRNPALKQIGLSFMQKRFCFESCHITGRNRRAPVARREDTDFLAQWVVPRSFSENGTNFLLTPKAAYFMLTHSLKRRLIVPDVGSYCLCYSSTWWPCSKRASVCAVLPEQNVIQAFPGGRGMAGDTGTPRCDLPQATTPVTGRAANKNQFSWNPAEIICGW